MILSYKCAYLTLANLLPLHTICKLFFIIQSRSKGGGGEIKDWYVVLSFRFYFNSIFSVTNIDLSYASGLFPSEMNAFYI